MTNMPNMQIEAAVEVALANSAESRAMAMLKIATADAGTKKRPGAPRVHQCLGLPQRSWDGWWRSGQQEVKYP
jgi:hypothetical protein